MSQVWYLEKVDLYEVLCPHKLKQYESNHFEEYGKGEFIYFRDDLAKSVYLVSKGKVKLLYYTESGEEVVKAVLTKGEIFGEMALLGEEKRSDFAVSLSDPAVLCPLQVETMYDLMRDNQCFNLAIHKIIGLRMKKLERRLELLFFKDVKTRLLDFISELAEEKGREENGKILVDHFYTHKDMADLTGSRRETITALLNELKEEGLLDYRRHLLILEKNNSLVNKV